MPLLKVYSKVNGGNKITIPRGICKEIDIKPGEVLELKVVGVNRARSLLITPQRRYVK